MGESVLMVTHGINKKESWVYKGKDKRPIYFNDRRESNCFFCKKKGHIRKDCPKRKACLKKKGFFKPKENDGKGTKHLFWQPLLHMLWQDSDNRVYLIKELDRKTGQGLSAVSVDDTLKIIACKDQQKRLAAVEMELAAARHEGFVGKYNSETAQTNSSKRLLAVVGIMTDFSCKNNRDAIRKSWLPTGVARGEFEEDKGVIIRFVIRRSANGGDSMDRAIDSENSHANDIIILDKHVEASEELPRKAKYFLLCYSVGAMLANHWDKPRVYIGCMKSGEVFSEPTHRWYEPDWWKFGDGKSYFRHACGEMNIISRALAQFLSINRDVLRTYAHDDVSAGSWFIGLDVKFVDEGKLCCSSSCTSGAICVSV